MQLLLLPRVAPPCKRTRTPIRRRIIPKGWQLPSCSPARSEAVARFLASYLHTCYRPCRLLTRLLPVGRAERLFPDPRAPELILPGWRSSGVLVFDGEAWRADFGPVAAPIATIGPRELLPLAVVVELMEAAA